MNFEERIFEADKKTLARLANEMMVEPSAMVVDDNKELVDIDRDLFQSTRYQFYTAGDYEGLVRFLNNGFRTDIYILDADFPRKERGKPELMFPEAVHSIRGYHKLDGIWQPAVVVRSGQDYKRIADELEVSFVGKGDKTLRNDLDIAEHYLADFNRQNKNVKRFAERFG